MKQQQQRPSSRVGRTTTSSLKIILLVCLLVALGQIYLLSWVLQQQQHPQNAESLWGLCGPTATNQPVARMPNSNNNNNGSIDNTTFLETPIVILSALRPQYLVKVLQSLERNNQHPHTPHWIANTTRYLFLHYHDFNRNKTLEQEVIRLANQYNYTLHYFRGVHSLSLPMNANANYVWYKMMKFLFFTLHVTEALIIEEDVPLAYDGLMMAARLLQEKRTINHRRSSRSSSHNNNNDNHNLGTTIHSISLGGWGGENLFFPHPDTYQISRRRIFQPMAYSMDRSLFEHIETRKAKELLYQGLFYRDWSEELGLANILPNIIQLQPTVSRMSHIGVYGMGPKGTVVNYTKTGTRSTITDRWKPWESILVQTNRTMDTYRQDPPGRITDQHGFVCDPPRFDCGFYVRYFTWTNKKSDIPRSLPNPIPQQGLLDPLIPVSAIRVSSSNAGHRGEAAIDGDLYTRWSSHPTSKKTEWIVLNLGDTPPPLSSLTIYWETAYATSYKIRGTNATNPKEDDTDWHIVQDVTNGDGYIDYYDLQHAGTFQFLDLQFTGPATKWGVSIYEIIVRGG